VNTRHLPVSSPAFSLLELLVVVGLMAALAFALMRGLGGGKAVALSSAQSLVSNLLALARARAVTNGTTTRLLFDQGPASRAAASRYLRYLVVQEKATDTDAWQMVADAYLPAGTCVLPEQSNQLAALLAGPEGWTRSNGSLIDSSALATSAEPAAVPAFPTDTWTRVEFSPDGTPDPSGGLMVVATSRTTAPTESVPVQLANPGEVRGLLLSRYGVAVWLNDRSEL
jgi:Tfp pilus assembly protein FimT